MNVPLKDLKRHLAGWVEAAARGERILVTRYDRPVAVLGPPRTAALHPATRTDDLRPLDAGLDARAILEVLADDRGGE